ncbi:MAG: DUF4340 domain-containing protein [Gammaproteobacteria bacterium]|nr:DUF4340 domain-containing protein [Gammaproteobacteria bacterium]
MKRSTINLLLLGAVIALLMITLYEPGVESRPESIKLLSLSADEVNEITINNRLQKSVLLKWDSQKNWQMVEPLQVRANHHKVESVLKILQQEPTNRFALRRDKLASYGLDNPQVELILNGEQRLTFGSQTPLNTYRYLQLGDEVLTIKDSAFYPIASRYTNFIDSKLIPDGALLASITLPEYQIQLTEAGWQAEPINSELQEMDELNGDLIAQWIDQWRYASSVDIEPIGMTDSEFGEVVVTLQSGEKLRWSIADQHDGLILQRPDLGIEYHLSGPQREALLLPPQPKAQSLDQEATL